MQTTTISPTTAYNIKAIICKTTVKKAVKGLTLQSLAAAFAGGCGIRKLSWVDGFMIYLSHPEGVIMAGNLNDANRADRAYDKEFALGNSPQEWEIVDRAYLLKRASLKKLSSLNNLLDSKTIESLAKNLKITL
jgi:hypothetical protein